MKIIKRLIEDFLDYFLKYESFRNYIKYRSAFHLGMEFQPHVQNKTIVDAMTSYKFQDINKEDVVLDLGGNIGGFALFASRLAKHVYVVEPLYDDILSHNIKLNDIKNITVLKTALGNKKNFYISYDGRSIALNSYSLTEIIDMCGEKITFLKMDCEGGEWCIKPEELKGIRRIEAEIHPIVKGIRHNYKDFLNMLDEEGFIYTYSINPAETLLLLHAKRSL